MPLIHHSVETTSGRVFHDWSMAVPSSRLWWGLTDPHALPHWLGDVVSGAFVTGGVVTIEHAEDYRCTSRIQEFESERLLGMTWQFPDEQLSHVRIMLVPGGGTTRLALTHEGLGSNATAYLPGWHTHLLYLEALLLNRPRAMDDFWSIYDRLAES